MPNRPVILTVSAFVFLSIIIAGCGKRTLFSQWRNSEITIDGKYGDWENASSYYDEQSKVVINLLNDKEYLYISLVTRNRDIEADIIRSGLSIWFDPAGQKNRNFGVCFPMGMGGVSLEDEDKRSREWVENGYRSPEREVEAGHSPEFFKKLEELEGMQYKLRLLKGPFDKAKPHGPPPEMPSKSDIKKPASGPPPSSSDKDGRDEFYLEEADKLGVQARLSRQNGYFVYELKIPLAKSSQHPYAIEAKPNEPLGMGIEIGGMAMMGMGPGGYDKEQGPGGERRGPPDRSRNFRQWFNVVLAKAAE